MTDEERAWKRGFDWANRNGYGNPPLSVEQSIRHCWIIAMAYAAGWLSAQRAAARAAARADLRRRRAQMDIGRVLYRNFSRRR
jgi:hypothetical protein